MIWEVTLQANLRSDTSYRPIWEVTLQTNLGSDTSDQSKKWHIRPIWEVTHHTNLGSDYSDRPYIIMWLGQVSVWLWAVTPFQGGSVVSDMQAAVSDMQAVVQEWVLTVPLSVKSSALALGGLWVWGFLEGLVPRPSFARRRGCFLPAGGFLLISIHEWNSRWNRKQR